VDFQILYTEPALADLEEILLYCVAVKRRFVPQGLLGQGNL
jgi:hypothetical protein